MKKIYLTLIILLGLHLLILTQLQFTAWPEMVSFPYLINHGFVLYKDAIHAYPPLLVTCLAVLYKIFGYKLVVLKLFGWGVILIGDILTFLIIKKLTGKYYFAFLALIFYISIQPILEGNMVWPDLFMIPFLLATILLILNKKYFYSGVAIGLALLTKQAALLYVVYSMLYIVLTTKNFKKLVRFLIGIAIVVLPFLAILVKQNSLQDFVNWTIVYPSTFWTKFPGYVNLSLSLRNSLSLAILFLPVFFLFVKAGKNVIKDRPLLFLLGFLVCGVIGVYPRFSFFHLQPALAFLVILVCYLVSQYHNIKYQFLLIIPILIVALSHGYMVGGEARFWAQSDIALAKEIQDKTPVGEPIYLLGLNSNLYVFANRLPSKPWLDNFGWYLEYPGVQEKVIKGFGGEPPSKIFWQGPIQSPVSNWYDIGTYQPGKITDWIKNNYNRKTEVEKGIWEWVKK